MKTTVDLPQELVRQFKLHALRMDHRLNPIAINVLHDAMKIKKDYAAGEILTERNLPILEGKPLRHPVRNTMSAQEMSDWVKEQDHKIQMEPFEKAFGH